MRSWTGSQSADGSAEKNQAEKVRGRLRVPVVYGLKKKLPLFLLGGFLRGLLCCLLGCHVVYSPFPSVMEHCDITSSQFVLCIESRKKIVKKKTRTKLRISVTRPPLCNTERVQSSTSRSSRLASRISHVLETSMNTGDSHRRIFCRSDRLRRSSFFAEGRGQLCRTGAPKIFFARHRNFVLQRTNLVHRGTRNATPTASDFRTDRRVSRAHKVSHRNMCSTMPLIASCHVWAIIPGRRLFLDHASTPNIRP
jgi:hypothetical protein